VSKFTSPLAVEPFIISSGAVRWRTLKPFWWRLTDDDQSPVIYVPAGFVFDGATVPFGLTLIFPRTHPRYLQAAALHDYALTHLRHELSRCQIDIIFKAALRALANPSWRVHGMASGVSAFGMVVERRGYYKRRSDLTKQPPGRIITAADLANIENGVMSYA